MNRAYSGPLKYDPEFGYCVGEYSPKDDREDGEGHDTTSSQECQEDESGSGSSQRHEGNSLDATANIAVLAETSFAEASSFHDRSMVMSKTSFFLIWHYVLLYLINYLHCVF